MRPRECRQAKVDGRRVKRIDGVGQIKAKILARVKLPRLRDQALGQFRMNAPVAGFVGIRQGGAPDR
jgi:hypothetical protein